MLTEEELKTMHANIRTELMGRGHASADELRNRTQNCGGTRSLPVDVLESNDREVHLILRTGGRKEIHIRAERTYPWHPFYVKAVESLESSDRSE